MRRIRVIWSQVNDVKPLKDFLGLDKMVRRDTLKGIKAFVLNEPQSKRNLCLSYAPVQTDGVLWFQCALNPSVKETLYFRIVGSKIVLRNDFCEEK